MNEVSSRPVRSIVASARKLGFDVGTLLAGLPFDEKSLEGNVRLDWDVFVTFVERLQRAAGGLEQLRKVGEVHQELQRKAFFPDVQKLAGQLVSPLRFFRFFWGPVSRSAFPHVVVDYTEKPPDQVTVTLTLPPKYRDCPGFFVLTEGATRNGTLYIGLPPCDVQMELRPRSATYRITLPRSRRLAATIDDVAEAAIAAIEAVHTRFIQMFQLSEATATATDRDRVARAAAAWGLTRREAQVFELLLRGQSNKEIAAALGCAEGTVELHVSHLLRKSGAASRMELASQFWSRT